MSFKSIPADSKCETCKIVLDDKHYWRTLGKLFCSEECYKKYLGETQ